MTRTYALLASFGLLAGVPYATGGRDTRTPIIADTKQFR